MIFKLRCQKKGKIVKVLWIVNKVFPYPARRLGMKENVFGGWLEGLANKLKDISGVNLAIATVYNGNKIAFFEDNNIKYYLIPGFPAIKYNKKLEEYWKYVKTQFNPDIVHIHGSEYSHGLAFVNIFPEIKTVVSIQGLISKCEEVYYANINFSDILKNVTLRDFLKCDNLINQKHKFKIRGKNEIELLKKVKFVIGRTNWDYANVKAINPDVKYYKGDETLRNSFYDKTWDIKKIERNSIFCSQAGYPIKGFHFLIQAIYLLRKVKPDIRLYVAGQNLFDSSIKSKIKRSGYTNYVLKLIKKYNVEEQIIFLGLLTENQMVDRLLKTNVFVLPSVIENSSNSLCEAMLLGMPCVASTSGGTMDLLENRKEGFLYPYTEPALCAEYILNFLNDANLAVKMGESARDRALIRHNSEKNVKEMLDIYKDILSF